MSKVKQAEYFALVAERKRCTACTGLINPSSREEFDSREIGPWTRLHGDLAARVMVVGQDWGDLQYFEENRGLDKLNNPTMLALQRLLAGVGIEAALDRYGEGASGVFLTNAILCLKIGGLQGPVVKLWFSNCAKRFLRRQVEIVRPQVVVPLGEKAYFGLCHAFNILPLPLRTAVSRPGTALIPGTTMVPVYHCGKRVQNPHRPLEVQHCDWQRVRMALADI